MEKDTTIKKELILMSVLLHDLHLTDALRSMEHGFVSQEELLMDGIHTFDRIKHSEYYHHTQSIPHFNSFEVPQGYFESNPDIIIDRIRKEKTTGVLIAIKSMWKFAIAACIIAFLGIGIFKFYKTKIISGSNTCMEVSCRIAQLPEQELISYLQENGTDVDAALVASLEEEDLPAEDELWMTEMPVKDILLNEQAN
jgi:hypothetical protein